MTSFERTTLYATAYRIAMANGCDPDEVFEALLDDIDDGDKGLFQSFLSSLHDDDDDDWNQARAYYGGCL